MRKSTAVQLVLFCLLLLLLVSLVGSFFISESHIMRGALLFSSDKSLAPTTIAAVRSRFQSMSVVLLVFLSIMLILLRYDTSAFKDKIASILSTIKWQGALSLVKNRNVLYLLILFFLLCFCAVCFFVMRSVDIGADEAYYLGSVKNFYRNGQFNLPSYEHAEFRSQLLYYPFFLLRQVFSFSMYSLRLLVFSYSLALLFFLYLLFRRNYSVAGYVLLLVLLISDRTFVLVSSTGFGEVPAFLFLMLGFIAWSSGISSWKKQVLTAAAFAVAALTKSQIAPILFVLVTLFIILRAGDRVDNMMLLFYTIVFYTVGALLFVLVQGYDLPQAAVSLWNILGRSSEVAFALPVIERLSHLNNFFNVINITIFVIVLVYQIIYYRETSLLEKVLFGFFLLNSLWWIFLYFGVNARNVVFSILINYVLFVIIMSRVIGRMVFGRVRLLAGILSLFLVFNFFNSGAFYLRLASKGISDEYNFALVGYETYSDGYLRSGQQDFFEYIDCRLEPGAVLYCISLDSYGYLFTEKEMLTVERGKSDLTLPAGSYVAITYIDYKNGFVWKELADYLNNNADLLFGKGLYEVYRVRN